jgi:hypothetical protein
MQPELLAGLPGLSEGGRLRVGAVRILIENPVCYDMTGRAPDR